MECPHCGGQTRVVDTRSGEGSRKHWDGAPGSSVWRRRKCVLCARTFHTVERPAIRPTETNDDLLDE